MIRLLALIAASVSLASCVPVARQAPPQMAMWRLDCGHFDIKRLEGRGPIDMPVSCYLIRHGDRYVMFDAGLEASLIGKPLVEPNQTLTLARSLPEQMREIGVAPGAVGTLVVSHYHGDHHGQADVLPAARLVIGRGDAVEMRAETESNALIPWLTGKRPIVELDGDLDLFGDGRVVALYTPGHTPGHLGLLVRLAASAYILTGDAVHAHDQLARRKPSGNHVDKVKGVASIDRLNALAAQLGATIIVGHDRLDVALLPAFPAAAK